MGPPVGRRRRPYRKYRPVYDYYYDDYEDDADYYEDEVPVILGLQSILLMNFLPCSFFKLTVQYMNITRRKKTSLEFVDSNEKR